MSTTRRRFGERVSEGMRVYHSESLLHVIGSVALEETSQNSIGTDFLWNVRITYKCQPLLVVSSSVHRCAFINMLLRCHYLCLSTPSRESSRYIRGNTQHGVVLPSSVTRDLACSYNKLFQIWGTPYIFQVEKSRQRTKRLKANSLRKVSQRMTSAKEHLEKYGLAESK